MSVKKVSQQNGGFIRATELAPSIFVREGKPFFFKLTRTCLFHKEIIMVV